MNRKKIGERLVELRGSRTQAAMAEIIGVSQSTYAMWETGQRIPSDEKKQKIAEVYEISVQALFFDNQNH